MKPTFAFLDEYGNLSPKSKQNTFVVGALISSFPDNLNDALHKDFEGLCSVLRKDSSRLEFHFSEVTHSSIDIYIKALNRLIEFKDDWRFCAFIVDLMDPNYHRPIHKHEVWEGYLRYIKILLNNNLINNEGVVLIADYKKRPRGKVHHLATLPQVIPNLIDTLKVESQGVLLVQLTDLIIGGLMYTGRVEVKKRIARKVKEIMSITGKSHFNIIKASWKKQVNGGG